MTGSLRTFIAVHIKPNGKLLAALNAFKAELYDEKIRFVDKDNMHLTLKFLGDTPVETAKVIGQKLEDVLSDSGRFSLLLKGIGYFKYRKQPSVIFVKTEPEKELTHLFELIEETLSPLGIPTENRDFHPHLTLARIKYLDNRNRFYELVEKYREQEFQSAGINEVIYYSSMLTPQGSVYRPLKIISLQGD